MFLGTQTTTATRRSGPETADAKRRVQFHAMGMVCDIQYTSESNDEPRRFAAASVAWVEKFEQRYSRFRPDSLIGRINAAAGRDWVALDADGERMFALVDQINLLTRGIIDPTVLPLLRLWNYRTQRSRAPNSDEIRAAMARVGWQRVRREPGRIYLPEAGMGLDFGGFGKEYAIDRLVGIARSCGIENVLVDFGSDMRAEGVPPDAPQWTLMLEDPLRPGVPRGRLSVSGASIATAGDFARFFELGGRRYGSIIDPTTGHPVDNDCHLVTVVAPSCLEAGVLATAAYVLGMTEGLRLIEAFPGGEGCITGLGREVQTRNYSRYVA